MSGRYGPGLSMYGDSFGGVDLVDTGSVQLGNYYDNPEDRHYHSTRMWK